MRFNIRWPLGQAPVWGGATVGERKALGRPYRRGEPAMYKVHLRARWLSALAVVACAVLLIPAASSAAPAGNNGTIKIDRGSVRRSSEQRAAPGLQLPGGLLQL